MVRVPYRDREDLPPDYRYLLDEEVLGERNIFRALGNNPPVLQSYMRFGNTTWQEAGLDRNEVELVILSVAYELNSRYEWHQHVPMAEEAGLSKEEITAISAGDLEVFDDAEVQLVQYAKSVVRGAVDDDVHDAIVPHFTDYELVGIAMIASYYLATARVLEALDVELEQDFVGWDLEGVRDES